MKAEQIESKQTPWLDLLIGLIWLVVAVPSGIAGEILVSIRIRRISSVVSRAWRGNTAVRRPRNSVYFFCVYGASRPWKFWARYFWESAEERFLPKFGFHDPSGIQRELRIN